MKYIILLILKFIWALILSVICTVNYIIRFLVIILRKLGNIIWYGKNNYSYWKFWQYIVYSGSWKVSPYAKIKNQYCFKSYYHYIWNIK
jgi:hypothetical protein